MHKVKRLVKSSLPFALLVLIFTLWDLASGMFVSDLSLAALLGWWAKEGLFSSRLYLILSLAVGVLNTPLLFFLSPGEAG